MHWAVVLDCVCAGAHVCWAICNGARVCTCAGVGPIPRNIPGSSAWCPLGFICSAGLTGSPGSARTVWHQGWSWGSVGRAVREPLASRLSWQEAAPAVPTWYQNLSLGLVLTCLAPIGPWGCSPLCSAHPSRLTLPLTTAQPPGSRCAGPDLHLHFSHRRQERTGRRPRAQRVLRSQQRNGRAGTQRPAPAGQPRTPAPPPPLPGARGY